MEDQSIARVMNKVLKLIMIILNSILTFKTLRKLCILSTLNNAQLEADIEDDEEIYNGSQLGHNPSIVIHK